MLHNNGSFLMFSKISRTLEKYSIYFFAFVVQYYIITLYVKIEIIYYLGRLVMLICPKCKSEYQEGYHICSDCKCDLIEIPDPIKRETIKSANMKKIIIGIVLLISSILIYIGISISAAICGAQLTEWNGSRGKIGTALMDNKILYIPGVIAVIMFIFGIYILYKEYKTLG